MNNKDPQ